MKTIFITISRGSLIRNFFHTGVISRILESGFRVVVLLPENIDSSILDAYAHERLLFETLRPPKKLVLHRFLQEMLKGAIFNDTVHLRYKYKVSGKKPSKLYYIPRIFIVAPLRFIPGFKRFARWLHYALNPQGEHDDLFLRYNPSLVFATITQEPSDVGVLKSAKRFGATTVQMPKSWDNLSKSLFPVKTDYMFVWGEFMREHAVTMQGYEPHEVFVTGGPQFDYYTKKDVLITRRVFCKKFGFSSEKPLILYGSAGRRCPHEAEYIALIREWMENGMLPEANILIRPHIGYVGDSEKFAHLEQEGKIAVDRTDTPSDMFKDHWDISEDHLAHLFNSLAHVDVCVHISSTLTIDASLCDTEVINISFDVDEKIPFHESPQRLYHSAYMWPVVQFGATWFAESKGDFKNTLNALLNKQKDLRARRGAFIRYFARSDDGQSAERISEALARLAS